MFRWIFHRRELLTTFDGNVYQDVQRKLAAAGIDYRTKWKDNRSSARIMGTLGEDPAHSIQYYIYVQVEDLERAEYLLR